MSCALARRRHWQPLLWPQPVRVRCLPRVRASTSAACTLSKNPLFYGRFVFPCYRYVPAKKSLVPENSTLVLFYGTLSLIYAWGGAVARG